MTNPDTGERMLHLQFEVQGFDSTDIEVKISNKKLIIYAVHNENDSGRQSTTEFCRRIKLPSDVIVDQLEGTFQDGVLSITAPSALPSEKLQTSTNPPVPSDDLLNIPLVKETKGGRLVQIYVEVGSVFRANDVVVKLKGQSRLVVVGERQENEDRSCTLVANIRREFELPFPISPASLKAGLTHNGVLTVTAAEFEP